MRSLSLFSGCMGLDLGLELSGIETVAYVDKDPACRATIRLNRPDAVIFEDVFDPAVVAFARRKRVDLITGGPPCQSFSVAGRRRFLDDERGKAMLGFVSVVEQVRSPFFLMENVQGLMSANGGRVIAELQDRFAAAGYQTSCGVLNAAEYGVPQARRRFIMIGHRGAEVEMPQGNEPTRTLQHAIGDLELSPGEGLNFSPSMQTIMEMVPEGGCWKSLPKRLQDKLMHNVNIHSGGLTSFFRRLQYKKPSPTLLTAPTHRKTTLCHPRQTRPLSVAEYQRIQCFPDDWKVHGSTRDKYRQLGNAVPVLFAERLGDAIVAA